MAIYLKNICVVPGLFFSMSASGEAGRRRFSFINVRRKHIAQCELIDRGNILEANGIVILKEFENFLG